MLVSNLHIEKCISHSYNQLGLFLQSVAYTLDSAGNLAAKQSVGHVISLGTFSDFLDSFLSHNYTLDYSQTIATIL